MSTNVGTTKPSTHILPFPAASAQPGGAALPGDGTDLLMQRWWPYRAAGDGGCSQLRADVTDSHIDLHLIFLNLQGPLAELTTRTQLWASRILYGCIAYREPTL